MAGENVHCVVSVQMLTEGWDVKSVSHILGIRAFGLSLLTEQIIGRGLRRTNYDVLNQPLAERPEGYEETPIHRGHRPLARHRIGGNNCLQNSGLQRCSSSKPPNQVFCRTRATLVSRLMAARKRGAAARLVPARGDPTSTAREDPRARPS